MPLLKKCVESIYDQVDKIIAVDGKYKDFPGASWYSTDGTIEYLSSLGKVELIFAADLFEDDKRNVYMNRLKRGDIALVIDGDEYIEGQIRKLGKGYDIGLILLGEPGTKFKRLATRYFKYYKGLKYNGIHFILELKGKWFNNRCHALKGFKEQNINTFKIVHLHRKRSRQRKELKEKYKASARRRESKFKIAPYE